MQTLYIFRHGETDYNKQRIIQGILDIPLNETGLQQAYALAELLSNSGIQLIYSSKLQRAHRTAEIVATKLNIPVEIYPGLHEMDMGECNGKPHDYYYKLIPNFDHISKETDEDYYFAGGESRLAARKRFTDAIYTILASTSCKTIGIAAHGRVIREFLRAVKLSPNTGLHNCQVCNIQFNPATKQFSWTTQQPT